MKYKLTLITLLALAGLLSCTNELKEQTKKPQETKNGLIAFNVKDNKPEDSPKTKAAIPFDGDDELGLKIKESVIPTTFDMTKAVPINSVSDILSESIGLVIMTADSENASSEAKVSFNGSPFTLTYNSSEMRFYPDTELWWPMKGKYMSFYAWLPESVGTLSVSDGNPPILNVEIAENVSNQIDLMYSTPVEKYDMPAEENEVNLTLNHGLTALRFKAETGMVVTSVKVSGVYDEGTFDLSSGTWSNLIADGNEYEITTHTAHAVEDFDVFDDEYTMFLLPQTCPAGSSITVEIDGVTKTASIAGLNLERGILNTFTVGQLPHPERQPLTLIALEDGTFSFTTATTPSVNKAITEISYSLDEGETWIDTPINNRTTITTPIIHTGEKVMWKGIATTLGNYSSTDYDSEFDDKYSSFSSTGKFDAEGNIASMVFGLDYQKYNYDYKEIFVGQNYITANKYNKTFSGLFYKSKIVDASKLIISFESLTIGALFGTFWKCTYLTKAPELPTTKLLSYAYMRMFQGCTSLTAAPELPASTFQIEYLPNSGHPYTECSNVYCAMFKDCSALITAPELPSTTLSASCYNSMFQNCTSLTNAPELPATVANQDSYNSMFKGCVKLTTPPSTMPTDMRQYGCCESMFEGCTKLTTTPTLPSTNVGSRSYKNMFMGCTSLTTPPVLPESTLQYEGDEYNGMFRNCTNLTSAPELPMTNLSTHSGTYEKMFAGCTRLTTPPALPSTGVGSRCYHQMFYNCQNLTTVPELPATTIGEYCYYQMFYGCKKINSTPTSLPAMTMYNGCYEEMFRDCSMLTTTCELPATSLASSCYAGMFYNCTNLTTTTTILPATTSQTYCYKNMFYNCGITTAPEIEITDTSDECCSNMFFRCAKMTTGPSKLLPTNLAKMCYQNMFSNCNKMVEAPIMTINTVSDYCCQSMFNGCYEMATFPITLAATTLATNCYDSMFTGCYLMTTAPALPATELANYCYYRMFNSCIGLTSTPSLPAETLKRRSYAEMFSGCQGITTITDFNAKQLDVQCCQKMFSNCVNLITVPSELPATQLAQSCYANMFELCSSLVIPPALPATTLADYCYEYMFYKCTSLTESPVLPALTLVNCCYRVMFFQCPSLNKITAYFTTEPTSSYTANWVYNVSTTGTFVKNAAATWDKTGTEGIPTGWTVETYTL